MTIDASKVYANDDDSNPSFWTVLPGGTHGCIQTALTTDAVIQAAVQASFDDPTNTAKSAFVIDHINRATVNCIGQAVLRKALAPEKSQATVYSALSGGTAAAIDAVIAAPANTALMHAFDTHLDNGVIAIISRQVGRALFQAVVAQGLTAAEDPGALLGKIEAALKAKLPHLSL